MAWIPDIGKFSKLNVGGEKMPSTSPASNKAKPYKPGKVSTPKVGSSIVTGAHTNVTSIPKVSVPKKNREVSRKAKAAARKLYKENTVKEVKSRGTWKSAVTGKEYRSKARALAAGKRSQEMLRNKRFDNWEERKQYLEDLEIYIEKFQTQEVKRKKKAAEKKALKEKIKEIEARNAQYEKALEEFDEYEEDEWEDAEAEVTREPYEDELRVYWEDVSHGLIGNPWYYEHGSGSWLYNHGYDSWNLVDLIKRPDESSEDGHTNREFVEQALKDSPYGATYEVYEDENGVPHIGKKF